jgi:hypothetical protein
MTGRWGFLESGRRVLLEHAQERLDHRGIDVRAPVSRLAP